MANSSLTVREVLELPAVVDIETARRALGLGRNRAYERAAAGTFPVPIYRQGDLWKVNAVELWRFLGIDSR